jgi:hypothetical protein
MANNSVNFVEGNMRGVGLKYLQSVSQEPVLSQGGHFEPGNNVERGLEPPL